MMLPSVLKKRTLARVILPENHRKPANGMTASLGTGATMLSSVIKNVTPTYPPASIIFTKISTKGSNMFIVF
jgi:hypothetical protein